MNCNDVTALLDKRGIANLNSQQEQELSEHLLICESCEHAWRASRVLRSFAVSPTPAPRAGLFEESLRLAAAAARRPARTARSSFWLGGALGAALAAGIAIVAVLGFSPDPETGVTDPTESLQVALFESKNITLAIDSPEALANAEIHLVLTGGIELAGRQGQRDLRWNTDISAGVNRLTIPVVGISSGPAELFVEVGHGDQYRRFQVPVDILQSADAADLTTG